MNPKAPFYPETQYYDEKAIGTIGGVTVRDYIAIEAMKALLSNHEAVKEISGMPDIGKGIHRILFMAYKYADALIEASNEKLCQKK